ncbi:TAXI family TRAP transporter solute-binding subunit [Nocardiopsis salina]|uniref:TAXI family TRAP transporter solute-binding subunit n=1 Tax=Nocardiopsis salina TaxID=245836 RepID=UPI00034A7C37|nr:TAXI family TRAP transporter solute-binding subunit [Nocardiopsis salina]
MHLSGPNRRDALLNLAGAAAALGVSGCTRGPASGPGELVVATGPPGAVYREIGSRIAMLLDEELDGTEVVTVETGASHDNLVLLEGGEAHLGLANLDSVLSTEAAEGSGIRAVGRLYDSFVHLVVMGDSPVQSIEDLDGRPVSIGEVNSGTEFTAEQVLAETGVGADPVRLDQAASAEALASGEIDAMFSLTGLPTPAIASLAENHDVRLIDLAGTADLMVGVHPDAYFPANIPATTYEGIAACPTMSIPNLLLCRTDLPDGLVVRITDSVYRGAEALAEERPEAAQINVRTGISTGVVPLHPGAAQWYREHKPA